MSLLRKANAIIRNENIVPTYFKVGTFKSGQEGDSFGVSLVGITGGASAAARPVFDGDVDVLIQNRGNTVDTVAVRYINETSVVTDVKYQQPLFDSTTLYVQVQPHTVVGIFVDVVADDGQGSFTPAIEEIPDITKVTVQHDAVKFDS